MKQIVLDLKSGQTTLATVPAPVVQPGQVLIQTTCSLVSLGTERMLVDFGKAGWMNKARQQPEKVQQVLNKIKTDGLRPALNAVFNKLGQPLPLGYSQCGIVLAAGKGVTGFKTGDRVISNGHHAEVVSVPQQLVAKVPDQVSDEEAAFTVVGAIALQSIRLINPTFGETIVVFGLGLIGQLTLQLLRANGCRAIGVDIEDTKVNAVLAEGYQAVNAATGDPVSFAFALTAHGVDGVIITATGSSSELISQAAQMCRKRGRIVLTGVTGLDLKRSDFYEKELSFQVSCSYGPGRYENRYEQQGLDYPIGFVRWTEQRNFEAVLQAMANGTLKVGDMIGQRLPLEDYQQVYSRMGQQAGATLLLYDKSRTHTHLVTLNSNSTAPVKGNAGIIGAGNFTTGVLIPCLKKTGIHLKSIASKGGLSAAGAAQKFGIDTAATDVAAILDDAAIDVVFITTRHQQHAAMVIAALQAGKHVFVEKPLAISDEELEDICHAYRQSGKQLFVGFNRRFAPMTLRIKELLKHAPGPVNIVMTVNAGPLPPQHWLADAGNGGRFIGEACHFIDLCACLTGSAITGVCANSMGEEDASILLRFADGSNAVINYFTNGSKAYDKERIELFTAGRTLILENWKKLQGYGFKNFSSQNGAQDKGHQAQFNQIAACLIKEAPVPIPFHELINVSKASVAVTSSLINNKWIEIDNFFS